MDLGDLDLRIGGVVHGPAVEAVEVDAVVIDQAEIRRCGPALPRPTAQPAPPTISVRPAERRWPAGPGLEAPACCSGWSSEGFMR